MKNITKMLGILGIIVALLLVPSSMAISMPGMSPQTTNEKDDYKEVKLIDDELEKGEKLVEKTQPTKKTPKEQRKQALKNAIVRSTPISFNDVIDNMGPVTAPIMLVVADKNSDEKTIFWMIKDIDGSFSGTIYTTDGDSLISGEKAWGFWDSQNKVFSGYVGQPHGPAHSINKRFYGFYGNGKFVALNHMGGVVHGDVYNIA